ncbi:hypothetical protein I545_0069 [Mycobacterium kansasii 662]|uniref:Uncharacterized protein n=1 Tax=Mycobacterium kansasii 662 TaxID=1299326 RepID=X7ZRJ6_MYCKA|nr:hypothetical protein I545_0069 [Mycobacterium kansasii 662]
MTTPSTVPKPALWTTDPSGSKPTMIPVAMSPTAMENLPAFVEHTTGPLTFCGWPPMMTLVSPDAAGVLLDAGADVELEAALGDVVELDDGPDLLSLEHPATPATMVAAPTAINNSRFTKFSFG